LDNSTKTTWFITGAASGFGLAFVNYALSQGYNVVALLLLKLDVTNPVDAESAVQLAIDKFESVDVVINNAGYGIVGAFEETPDSELRAQMETNFFGTVNVTRAVLPVLRKQSFGAIVNLSSMGGQLSFSGFSAYSASKFAVEGFSEALAQEVAPFGIKVLIVEPGAFRTGFASDALKHMPRMSEYDTIVGGTRDFAKGMDGSQKGDPAKAASAIDKAIRDPETPVRLQLGSDSVNAVRAHAESLINDLNKWSDLGLATEFENS
jgi:NAD(P)-dependent dehydrogenase (short-subunit alcohol dehydrogenase family)